MQRYGNTDTTAPRLRFEVFPWAHPFSRRQRSHIQDYDSYAVNGILRSTWLVKHHTRIPAVILAVFEFDARSSAADWATAEAGMCSAVGQLRADFAKDRQVDIHVLLVQDKGAGDRGTAPAVPAAVSPALRFISSGGSGGGFGEDRAVVEAIAERVGALRRKAFLDGNSITMLYMNDCSPSTVVMVSLEALLRERAYGFYTTHIRRWKRTVLPRLVAVPMHLPLRVRVLFKIAHYQEFRLRSHKALKYYAQAYATLMQIPRLVRRDGQLVSQSINQSINQSVGSRGADGGGVVN